METPDFLASWSEVHVTWEPQKLLLVFLKWGNLCSSVPLTCEQQQLQMGSITVAL